MKIRWDFYTPKFNKDTKFKIMPHPWQKRGGGGETNSDEMTCCVLKKALVTGDSTVTCAEKNLAAKSSIVVFGFWTKHRSKTKTHWLIDLFVTCRQRWGTNICKYSILNERPSWQLLGSVPFCWDWLQRRCYHISWSRNWEDNVWLLLLWSFLGKNQNIASELLALLSFKWDGTILHMIH